MVDHACGNWRMAVCDHIATCNDGTLVKIPPVKEDCI